MPNPILVTGATGNTGREVVRALVRRGLPVRAGVRRPEGLEAELGVPAVSFDFAAPHTWGPAAEGCAGVFLLRPPAIAQVRPTLNAFVDVARARGVGQVVFLSVAGAGENRLVPHHAVERHLAERGGDYTLLRPGFFAQNLQDAYRRDLLEDDRLYVPAGAGRVAFVDLHDVAEVAAHVFAEPGRHAGAAYTLTGPVAESFHGAARLLSEALDRPIHYRPASIPGYLHHLVRRRGLGLGQAAVQTVLHVGLRRGAAETVDPTLAGLLGHPGRPLATYVAEHAHLWRRGPAPSL